MQFYDIYMKEIGFGFLHSSLYFSKLKSNDEQVHFFVG